MQILFLLDTVYFPAFGGSIKASRCLLAAMAALGHDCHVICRAFTRHAGPATTDEFLREAAMRRIAVTSAGDGVLTGRHEGVSIYATTSESRSNTEKIVLRLIRELDPEIVLVSDDQRRTLLETSLNARPKCLCLVLQTLFQLPFGPCATAPDPRQAHLMRLASGIVVISEFMQNYILKYGRMESVVLRLPIFWNRHGTLPAQSYSESGFVTTINPCIAKGLPVFLGLARSLPHVKFAAVASWGTDDAATRELRRVPNIEIWPPREDIERYFLRTRVLLVPSLCPETLGYVAIEAMIHGIPVIVSNSGGLPEAVGPAGFVIPVRPARWNGRRFVSPRQEVAPWVSTLRRILTQPALFAQHAHLSRIVGRKYFLNSRPVLFENFIHRHVRNCRR